jgi:hypothetical protein
VSVAKPIRHPPKAPSQGHKPRRSSFADSLARRKTPRSSAPDITDASNTESEPHLAGSQLVSSSVAMKLAQELGEVAISHLRDFFELLDRWDREDRVE